MNRHPVFYPLMVELTGRKCVVIGGGPIGWRKTASLLECGASVVVIAPHGVPALAAAASERKLTWYRRPFKAGDLEGASLAFAATNDRCVNAEVKEEASRQGVWLNAAYNANQGNFLVPAVVRRGKLVMAVTTGGASPMLARRIAGEWEKSYGAEYVLFVDMLDRLRGYVLESEADEERKLLCLGELLREDILERLRKGESEASIENDLRAAFAERLS